MKSIPIVVVSDLHVNSTLGIYPPGLELEDGGEYKQNRFQSWLWNNWIDFCSSVEKDSIVVVNGDLVQGIHPNRDSQIVTPSSKDMRRAAIRVLEPLLDKSKKTYVIRGTSFHDGVGAKDAETIAEDISAEKEESTGQYSRWSLWLNHEDKLYFFTHHISLAQVYPLTPLAKELNRAKMDFVDSNQPIPDVMVRSHVHKHDFASDGRRFIFVTPAWQLRTEFLYKKNPMVIPDIGALTLWAEDGETRWKYKLYPIPAPTIEKS